MEATNPFRREISRLKEGDYPALLLEISAYLLASANDRVGRHEMSNVLELLNKSYDLFGEGSVSSEFAWEISTVPKELDDPNPMFRIEEEIRTIEGQFSHIGYGYGFNFFEPENTVVVSFTDGKNPFQVVNPDGPPEIVKTYHIPVLVPHSVSMMNGYQLKSA